MPRPVKKTPEAWKRAILDAAQVLFLEQGYEETSVSAIMERAGGAKGMFYRCFRSKEEVMQELCYRLFAQNNPFEAVQGRSDLNGLQKVRQLLSLNRADAQRNQLYLQAMPILEDPQILAAAVEANRRVLTPLWFALLEEGRQDGSIRSEYTKELSELLPLVNFWMMPSLFPADGQELRHKYRCVVRILEHLGLPLFEGEAAEELIAQIAPEGGETP